MTAQQDMAVETLDTLVPAARAGSPSAFSRIWEHLSPAVAGYVRGRGVRDPDDVTSEVFLAVFRSLPEFEGNGSAFRSWVFTIAHHRAVDALRVQARYRCDGLLDDDPSVPAAASAESTALDAIEAQQALELVHRLPDDQRDVLLLRVAAGLPAEEVAEVLDRSAEAVRQLHHRALARLRRLIAEPVQESAGDD